VEGCINATDGFSLVCSDCWARRHNLRADIPRLWEELRGELGGGSSGLGEGLSRPRPGSRPPLQLHVLDTLAAVVRRLVGWADACLDAERLAPLETEQCRQSYLIVAATAVLDRHDEVLRTSPAVHRYLAALSDAHRRLTLLIGLEPTMTRLAMPCSACEQRVVPLFRDSTRQCVTCTVCLHVTPDSVWVGHLLDGVAP
jgi:hypothetical protein